MSLQRPAGPFHRPYSPPEPPAPPRRLPKRLAVLVTAGLLAAAAVAVFLLAPDRGRDKATVRPSPPVGTLQSTTLTTLPPPCGAVSKGTIDRAVPMATRTENANSTLTTCTYTPTGAAFPWLRVEVRLYASGYTTTPVKDAEDYYDTQWTQARDARLVRTIRLERDRALGDEAYRWYRADEGRPSVVGQVTARTRNTVFTVTYAERAPGRAAQDAREGPCIATATAVAREVLAALNHF
ncbi:hypothetical protein E1264_36665 [Actinomadura sp. KC216]|uniref:hypothetical protein n=1 Tax=Actinomadura sp. KC216 TaxID=2530370 RepID=UPI0010537B70|nr:hypothetical protein [Actinomadura sp. KC216]TDB78672.1 hypothetical protein E1264_36665 [Actinomadura sp. KC216]